MSRLRGLTVRRVLEGLRWRSLVAKRFVSDVWGPYLRAMKRPRFRSSQGSDVIVALTTWRERIGSVWAVVDTLFEQDAALAGVVLVLSREEFPGERVPRPLARRVRRGLTVLWVDEDNKSFDKLVPVLQAYPSYRVITVDDDMLYGRTMASELISVSDEHPGAIIGHKGVRVRVGADGRIEVLQSASLPECLR